MARQLLIGLYSPFFGSTYGGGEKYFGTVAEALRDAYPQHRIEILSAAPVDLDRYRDMLNLDLEGVSVRGGVSRGGGLGRRLRNVPQLRPFIDLALCARLAPATARYDLLLSMVYVLPAFSRARRGVVLCQFPYPLDAPRLRLRGRLVYAPYRFLRRLLLGDELGSFQRVICQSEYVRRWVRELWRRDSLVVNPPIELPAEEPDWDAKDKVIVSVGRFFASGHSKRHDVMARAFRELCDEGLRGWELHLVGSVHRGSPADVAYFERVQELAHGYPIHVHPDAPGATVDELYWRASVYWHAAGYGVDETARPAEIEHFGMTTVEAMGRGVVPIAIGQGGQLEVIEDGITGFLWHDLADLKRRTLDLVADPELRRRMGEAARRESQGYSVACFKSRMVDAVAPVVGELERENLASG